MVRSHIPPLVDVKGYKLGMPFQIKLVDNSTIDDFIQKLFLSNKDKIGYIAVNGQIVNDFINLKEGDDKNLKEGDEIQIFSLISGG